MEKIRPRFVGYFMTHYFFVIPLAIVLLALAFINIDGMAPFFLFVAALVLLISLVHSKVHEMVTCIYIEDNKFVHESGILKNKKNNLPISMVTDSLITRNIMERVLGVCTLNVNTSGTGAYEVICDALDFGEADKINNLLHEMIHGHAGKKKKR